MPLSVRYDMWAYGGQPPFRYRYGLLAVSAGVVISLIDVRYCHRLRVRV